MELHDKRVLIVGGTGSLGHVLVRRLLSRERGGPRKVVVLSRDEAKQHQMRLAYQHRTVSTDEVIYHNFERALEFRIGDVRSYADVSSAIRDADLVINAAALKQVPTCEYFPEQAVMTNCLGAGNLVRAIHEHGDRVEAVVGISTDKAAKPVNVMGMTKALSERILVAGNVLSSGTRFVCVRYGNVLASRGSVIPLFHEQIRRGGPVTVTAPGMTRFLMTLEQAVEVIFEAIRSARPGEILVPRAPAATVADIAHALIGDRPVEVAITGTRPGEKRHEILVSEEECHHTFLRNGYYVIAPMLPELSHGLAGEELALAGEYSSADAVIGLEATAALLRRHRLMVDDVELPVAAELLR
jgi:UDP-glucose 4-epimerase